MKVCVIQPAYSTDYARSDECFAATERHLAQCDESLDLIVLPESCDIPCVALTKDEADRASARYNARLLQLASRTAARCGAMLFLNARSYDESAAGRNTTYAFDREGRLVGKYFKAHLTPSEEHRYGLDASYTYEPIEPTVVEIEGVRFGFLTCYDFYFYEAFSRLARKRVDVIIGCSHQRSDTHEALSVMTRHLAYNTNAFVVRASVSMGKDSPVGGGSMIVAPNGDVLVNMKSEVGLATAEIDLAQKYYKPAGYGNPPSAHYEYVEQGRRPWQYRPAGSAIVRRDADMAYPRVCAHRGWSTVAPENTLPAFGAAVGMGAEEIEFDLWFTKDGTAVSLHDPTLERVSDGTGSVWEYTLAELAALDFGAKHDARFQGLRIATLEEILRRFGCHCVMNIHLKTEGEKPEYLAEVVRLIEQYDCTDHVYFMSGQDDVLARLQREFPQIARCCGAGDGAWNIVERAIRYGCRKVQLLKPSFDQAMIDRAHAHGIVCNVFWTDDEAEAQRFLDMGIDVLLTNDFHRIARIAAKKEKYGL